MNSLNKTTNALAGFVAILATAVICGGTLSLADNYARSGASGQDYVAAAHHVAPATLKRAA